MCAFRPSATCPIRCRWSRTWWSSSTRARRDAPSCKFWRAAPLGGPFSSGANRGQRFLDRLLVAGDEALEATQADIDRLQLHDGGPGAGEELERRRHLPE